VTSAEPIKVAISVQVMPGVAGGVVQALVGLIHFLGKLDDGPENYRIVVETYEMLEWIKQYCGPNQQIVMRGRGASQHGNGNGNGHHHGDLKKAARTMLRPVLPALRYVKSRLNGPRRAWPEVAVSDGFFESVGDVVHFPTQGFTLCARPSVYNPHDLQHLHYPQFFTAAELAARETIYHAGCRLSHTVVVGSQWIKDDVVSQYNINPGKIQIIPWAAPTHVYPKISQDDLTRVAERYSLAIPFCVYPAVTWPHKNHIRLLEALALLRDQRGLRVNLACTGSRWDDHWPNVEARIRELRLENQVKFLGFVPEADLRAIYRLSQFLVLPTLFEADSCPIHEAWVEDVPVASSNSTALPEQVADAGLLFDATDVVKIAGAVEQLTTDAHLREELRQRGRRRLKDFDWERTAKAFRAVYRRAANAPLSEEDRWLLSWNWMTHPQRSLEASP
jgi:glycosyltransferase involved in cell wall biosynthesis